MSVMLRRPDGDREMLLARYAPSVPGTLPPGPFGTMTGGTGADGSPGRDVIFFIPLCTGLTGVLFCPRNGVRMAIPGWPLRDGEHDGVQRADGTHARAHLRARGLVGSGLAGGTIPGCHRARAGPVGGARGDRRARHAGGRRSAILAPGHRDHRQPVDVAASAVAASVF